MTQDPQRLSDTVSRRKFIAATGAASAAAIAGCTENTGEESEGLSGDVVVKGSSTVFPVSDTFAENFMEENSDVNVTVDSTGSGGGFKNHFCPGEADLNGASRPITGEEEEQCGENDVTPVEFQVASDAVTMAVNNEADFVDCVTPDEMSQIWREGGAEQWSDVRDEWPDEDIVKFGPAETSGTYDWFNENIVGEDYNHTAEHQPTEEDETIVAGIRDNEYAIGYFGYAYYNSNSDDVKALEVDGGDGCTEPSLANAKDGSYPMARPLFIYASESSLEEKDQVYAFLEYFLENAETETVEDIGYVPSNTELRDQNLSKLEEYDTGSSTSTE
ncbi:MULTISPECIES: PstS family phosphate ABC transporter substrate-binding protein [Haloarcula]|uniref:PstS family phosphate ABC transporter substrate-binding protein n=1 Tax=Haloarcula TaxID=2237 RepID=UPI0023E796B5|nr:PstS family phosphate ABC transporter substrate-binding protein [Halomicroarcula sp. SHR3]